MRDQTTSREVHDDTVVSLLPVHTREVVTSGTFVLPGTDAEHCEGAEYHSPRPLFVRATPLVRADWWPDNDRAAVATAPTAHLCGTCRDNLDLLLQMIHAADGLLDWRARREFGNKIRALASRGWTYYEAHR